MVERETLGLARLYKLLKNPAFIRKHSIFIEEDGHKLYMAKAEVPVHLLGTVTLETAFYSRLGVSIPVILLSREQVKILRENGIRFPVKRRKQPEGDKIYIGFPNMALLEKIDKM